MYNKITYVVIFVSELQDTRFFPPSTTALRISSSAVTQIVYSLVYSPYLGHMKSEEERVVVV